MVTPETTRAIQEMDCECENQHDHFIAKSEFARLSKLAEEWNKAESYGANVIVNNKIVQEVLRLKESGVI